MAYVKKLFADNFLYYASYVIKDRAIPDLDDGLKPVQRRILHSLFEMDDGKYHKVANVIGHCMQYHPHGDQSIGSALVVLANKGLFIDRQGNFGNIFTGDEASAPRYIECRASAFAKEVFYNPKVTEYVDSYDGRNKEPVKFPAKLPVVLLMGAEGIAVGMSTKILPHNPLEVIRAEIACLQGKKFELYPDFPTGGIIDLSEYNDGNGRVKVRAKLDTSDPKKIVIREIPFSSTTETLIASIEAAQRSGQLKVASISDFTTDKVEIEIRLQRGVYTQDVVDALYAFTECEQSISCNCLVIQDEKPVITSVSEIVRHHAGLLLSILRKELEIERSEILDAMHARTLERIFIEERVYKKIEAQKTQEAIFAAVLEGLKPYSQEIGREVSHEDVERLLKIPIRRISLYDINKAKEEMDELASRLVSVESRLKNLVEYAIECLKGLGKKLEHDWPRRTKIERFSMVEARDAARRDIALRYDAQTGYIGTAVSSGEKVLEVSAFDRILIVRRSGLYTVVPVPEKLFVDRGLQWVTVAHKDYVANQVLTIVYKAADTGYPFIKRCSIKTWITGRDYSLIPEGAELLLFSTDSELVFTLTYAKKPRIKRNEETFRASDWPVRGLQAQGIRLATRQVLQAHKAADASGSPATPAQGMPAQGTLSQGTLSQDTPSPDTSPASRAARQTKQGKRSKRSASSAAGTASAQENETGSPQTGDTQTGDTQTWDTQTWDTQTGDTQNSAGQAAAQAKENVSTEQVTSKDDQETNADNVKIDEEGRGLFAKVSRRLGRSGTSSSDSSSSKAQELDFGDADKGDKE
ncbi:MAG: DNA topoisomerase IV subunit A [Rectinema sp.]